MKAFVYRSALALLLATPALGSEIVLDNFTAGTPSDDTPVIPSANTFAITENLGQRADANLLHSFARFTLSTSDTAEFSGDAGIRNIVSRVSGGDVSTIDGTIRSTIAGASFWFLNPAGIVMGPDAQIEVTGTIALGAADFLVLSDGSLLSLQSSSADVALMVAEPESFGFLESSTAGDLELHGFQLVEADAASSVGDLVFTGGSVSLDGGTQIETLEGGDIIITSNGDIRLTGSTLASRAIGDAGATSGGISLQGRNVALDSGVRIATTTAGAGDAGAISIVGTSSVTANVTDGAPVLTNVPTVIVSGSETTTSGSAGNITIDADAVHLARTEIRTATESSDSQNIAADIDIAGATRLVLTDVDVLTSTNGAVASGDITLSGGAIDITGRLSELNPDKTAKGGVEAITTGVGNAGDIRIGGQSITLNDGAKVTSISGQFGNLETTGDAGAITLTATDTITMNRDVPPDAEIVRIFSRSRTASSGAVGQVALTADSMDLRNGFVHAQTDSDRGGDTNNDGLIDARDAQGVAIVAAHGLSLTNVGVDTTTSRGVQGGDITLSGGAVHIVNTNEGPGTRIRAGTGGDGHAGDIRIVGDSITLINQGSGLFIDTATGIEIVDPDGTIRPKIGTGDAGSITLQATGQIQARGTTSTRRVEIESESRTATTGAAGSVTIAADSIDFTQTEVSAATESDRLDTAVGSVSITGTNRMDLTNVDVSTLATRAASAGDVTLTGAAIALTGVSRRGVESVTNGAGNAGNVRITAQSLTLNDDARIAASTGSRAAATGNAGTIALTAADSIETNEGLPTARFVEISTLSGRGTSGAAGKVSIDAPVVDLNRTTVSAKTDSDRAGDTNGDGAIDARDLGSVDIAGARVLSLTDVEVEASTTGAASAGDVSFRGGAIDITSSGVRRIRATTEAAGNGGDIRIAGDSIAVNGLVRLQAVTGIESRPEVVTGNAGTIALQASGAIVLNGGAALVEIEAESRSPSTGAPGRVEISGDSVDLTRVVVDAVTRSQQPGEPASVDITATRTLRLTDVDLKTSTRAINSAADITLSAGGAIEITRRINTGIESSTTGPANAGSIQISGESIALNDRARVSASTGTLPDPTNEGGIMGNAGTIALRAVESIKSNEALDDPAQRVVIDTVSGRSGAGPAGKITLEAPVVDLNVTRVTSLSNSDRAVDINGDGAVDERDAPSIDIIGRDSLSLTDVDVLTTTRGAASAGNITLSGGVVEISDRIGDVDANGAPAGGVEAATTGAGNAGSVVITGESVALNDGARIAVTTGPRIDRRGNIDVNAPTGDAGAISIGASGAVQMNDGLPNAELVRISSESRSVASGAAGRVTIAGDSVDLNNAQIQGTTERVAVGDASTISIQATNAVALTNVDVSASTNGGTHAGNIFIEGRSLEMTSGSLQSSTTGLGNAGRISIGGDVDDTGNVTTVMVGPVSVSNVRTDAQNAAAAPEGEPRANAGSIDIRSNDLLAVTGTVSSSAGVDAGSAGTIDLVGNGVSLNDALLSTSTGSTLPTATPATIRVDGGAGPITLTNSGMEVSTSGAADAGDILITGNSFTMAGVFAREGDPDGVGIEASTVGTGDAGAIIIAGAIEQPTAGLGIFGVGVAPLAVTIGGFTTAAMSGNVSLDGAAIASTTTGQGASGDIVIDTTGLFQMVGSNVSTSATAEGNGGNINLSIGSGIIRSQSLIQTTAQQGNGGVINISVVGEDQLFLMDTESIISAASDEGTSGTVTVTAPDTDIDAAITPQDARIVQDVRLAADACSRAARAAQSSFVLEDRGGLPPSPNDYLAAGSLYSSDAVVTQLPLTGATVAMQGCP